MRKPQVDYRQFRFSKINTPQFSHLKLLLGRVGYFILYFLTDNLIPVENCHGIHCGLTLSSRFASGFYCRMNFGMR